MRGGGDSVGRNGTYVRGWTRWYTGECAGAGVWRWCCRGCLLIVELGPAVHIVMSCESDRLTTRATNGGGKIEFPCSKCILIDGMDIPHSFLLML